MKEKEIKMSILDYASPLAEAIGIPVQKEVEPIKNNISLQFPAWEYIKKLSLAEEYRWIIFYTGIPGTYGILTWNEDGQKKLIFDVFVGGHSGESGYEKVFAGNKEGYRKMCKYVFNVYQIILRNLKSDVSWQWEVSEFG